MGGIGVRVRPQSAPGEEALIGLGLGREVVRLAVAAMGTRFELVLPDGDPWRLRAAGEAALERITDIHGMLSRFDGGSLLAHAARSARPVAVDAAVSSFLRSMTAIVAGSNGAFDPCFTGAAPFLDGETGGIQIAPDAPLPDFGACAKGFAVDQAVVVLRDAGIEAAFIHGGRSSGFGLGRPPGAEGWRIALGSGPAAPVVALRDLAFSVSEAEVVREGRRHDHTVDPRTGTPPGDRGGAVVGPSAAEADAWSTAVVVLGRRPAALDRRWRVWRRDAKAGWLELREGVE